jgi:hypothetical protein
MTSDDGMAQAGRRLRISFFWVICSMPLIEIVIVLIVVGVLLWLVNTYIPMAGPIKSLLNAVVVIVMVVWVLKIFGLWHYITHIRAG